jgi:hypothetical protein
MEANPIDLINRDTISTVGLIMSRSLPSLEPSSSIRVFRHAVSLDEVCV